jgi:hypothetical protein
VQSPWSHGSSSADDVMLQVLNQFSTARAQATRGLMQRKNSAWLALIVRREQVRQCAMPTCLVHQKKKNPLVADTARVLSVKRK